MQPIPIHIENAKKLSESEAFIIGGGEIYKQSMPLANKLYLTRIHEQFEGDTFFKRPNNKHWSLISSRTHFFEKKTCGSAKDSEDFLRQN